MCSFVVKGIQSVDELGYFSRLGLGARLVEDVTLVLGTSSRERPECSVGFRQCFTFWKVDLCASALAMRLTAWSCDGERLVAT